jgi:hypothetical protein
LSCTCRNWGFHSTDKPNTCSTIDKRNGKKKKCPLSRKYQVFENLTDSLEKKKLVTQDLPLNVEILSERRKKNHPLQKPTHAFVLCIEIHNKIDVRNFDQKVWIWHPSEYE